MKATRNAMMMNATSWKRAMDVAYSQYSCESASASAIMIMISPTKRAWQVPMTVKVRHVIVSVQSRLSGTGGDSGCSGVNMVVMKENDPAKQTNTTTEASTNNTSRLN